MLKDFLNEAKGFYEKNYETDEPERYYCSGCLSIAKKDLKEEMEEDGNTQEEINSELNGRYYPVGTVDKPTYCNDCGQYIGILSAQGKIDLLEKARDNAEVEIEESKYAESSCYCNFGDYNDSNSFMEIFDSYGLINKAIKLAIQICDKFIKDHPEMDLVNGEEI